ncbi:hypothetical protein NPIL_118391 [Nephila pilipes]|uniref:DUF19 domain-containing protein n=1 Tax=Nephila pilipes TaxID=299642 RepID=A0A8X6P5S1_NEPPI|nr:hypothetical protein NPIL_118391 [Nephila pilipes]
MLNCFLLFGVLTVTNAFGPPAGPPSSPGGPDVDETLYPCYTSINCIYKGTDEHKRIEKCLDSLKTDDVQTALNWYDKNLKATDYKNVYDAIDQLYCDTDIKTRKFIFDKIGQGCVDIYSMGCERRFSQEVCDRWTETLECAMDLLSDLDEEGKCDIEEFEKGSL